MTKVPKRFQINPSFVLVPFIAPFLLIGSFFIFSIINKPFSQVLDGHWGGSTAFPSGASSFSIFILLIAIPRIVYVLIFAGGVAFLLKNVGLQKKLIIVILISTTFFVLIFPKKALILKIPAPPETYKAVYRYDSGAVCFDVCDSASVYFFTDESLNEINKFYNNSGTFLAGPYGAFAGEYGPLEGRKNDYIRPKLSNGEWISAGINNVNGRRFLIFSKF